MFIVANNVQEGQALLRNDMGSLFSEFTDSSKDEVCVLSSVDYCLPEFIFLFLVSFKLRLFFVDVECSEGPARGQPKAQRLCGQNAGWCAGTSAALVGGAKMKAKTIKCCSFAASWLLAYPFRCDFVVGEGPEAEISFPATWISMCKPEERDQPEWMSLERFLPHVDFST
jgi:hypothetical protein